MAFQAVTATRINGPTEKRGWWGPEGFNPLPPAAIKKIWEPFGLACRFSAAAGLESLLGKSEPGAEPLRSGVGAAHLPVQPSRLVHAEVPGAPHPLDGHGAHGHGADLQQTCGDRGESGVSSAAPSHPIPSRFLWYSLCGLWLPAASTRPSPPIRRKQLKSPCLLAV